MKAVIRIDVPEYQIGQEVSIYFKDTMMIKGTVQKPSDDAISRQAVFDYIYNDLGLGDEENGKDVERLMELESSYKYIKSLPPVNPQPKTGHWEWLTEDKYRCSNCNHETRVDECMNKPMYEFCPFCGAKMVKPQESEK